MEATATPKADDPGRAAGTCPVVVTLCTGNAARSVMAGAMLAGATVGGAPARIVTAGTHVVEGQVMSRRTRAALAEVGFSAGGHRSHQLSGEDVESADLIVAMASEHVRFMRRVHPGAAGKVATIKRLCRDLMPGPEPLVSRISGLDLGAAPLDSWEDVEDPAGGDDETYLACAKELVDLCADLLPRLA